MWKVTVMASVQYYLSTFWGFEENHDTSRLTLDLILPEKGSRVLRTHRRR